MAEAESVGCFSTSLGRGKRTEYQDFVGYALEFVLTLKSKETLRFSVLGRGWWCGSVDE